MNSGEEEKVNEKRGELLLLMGEKLKRVGGTSKREGNSTPSPTWKLGLIQFDGKTLIQDLNFSTKSNNNLSARKLGANLWEMQPLRRRSNMADNFPSFSHHRHKDVEEEEYSPLNQLKNGVNSRKQNSPSLTRHNRRVEKVAQAQHQLSTASYCSSMEVAPHRPAISPNSSLPSTSKFGESSHSLKTSTELLKVLNRIWSLEEKHALDMSLVKTLRNELDQSHARIQELLQEKETELNKMDTLTKQVSEYKSELKLKRISEKRHKKLNKELLEIKSLFSNALTELEQERKARTLIEDLCDEFAKGIREYEQELRLTKHKTSSKDKIPRKGNDRLVLHISEAWLDERAQMKLAGTRNVLEKQSSLDKLIVEIEAFLRVKQSSKSDILSRSLESIHLNEPASAPWKGNEEDDSASISNHCAQFRHANETGLSENEESPATKKSRMENPYDAKSLQRFYRNRMSDADVELKDARIRNRALESEDKRVRIWESNCPEGSFDAGVFAGPPSPVRKWKTDHEIYVSSSPGWQKSVKADTLKAKLMEARQQSRARISKG
ncbi:hypothetical protein ABFS83_02G170000 [Erythranthe nasuta]